MRGTFIFSFIPEKRRYDNLRDNLHGLHQGFRKPLPQDQKLEEELQKIAEHICARRTKADEENSLSC